MNLNNNQLTKKQMQSIVGGLLLEHINYDPNTNAIECTAENEELEISESADNKKN